MVGLAFLVLLAVPGTPAQNPSTSAAQRPLSPFLDDFRAHRQPALIARDVAFQSAVGLEHGYLARPNTPERLPAVLLIPGKNGLDAWMKGNARHLAGIGYVTFAVTLSDGGSSSSNPVRGPDAAWSEEKTIARLAAAVRWLRRRREVQADQFGVIGWDSGAGHALALAASTRVQACVVCDRPVSSDAATYAGLRAVPLLAIFAGKHRTTRDRLPSFRKTLRQAGVPHRIQVFEGVGAGFMQTAEAQGKVREAADRAYFEIYEFLDKHVEGGAHEPPATPRDATGRKEVATIADLMRAVNSPSGVRGSLIKALEHEPAGAREWQRVRANAALVAEAGRLLENRRPPRGPAGDWEKQVRTFTADAESIARAADQRDYRGSVRGLKELATRCAECHRRHR
jgi:dienelactone hydrolase